MAVYRNVLSALVLIFNFIFVVNAASIPTITTATGRLLSPTFLSQHFPRRTASHVSRSLYEITSLNTIVSHSAQHDISAALAAEANVIHPNNEMTVSLNGVRITPPNQHVLVHTDPESLTSVHMSSGGNILAIHIPVHGLSLMPVDSSGHPGLFYSLDNKPTAAAHTSSSTLLSSDLTTTARQSGKSCSDSSDSNAKAVNIAVAFDSQYCSRYSSSSDAIASITSLISESNEPYKSSTCLRLQLSHVDARCDSSNDPYGYLSRMDAASILTEFVKIWTKDEEFKSIDRDVAFLVSGFDEGTSTAGRAYVGVVCSMTVGFGWSEGNSVKIFAHELGHTLDADHDSEGLMKGMLGPDSTMGFSSRSVREMVEFVDTRAICLQSMDGEAPKKKETSLPTSTASMIPMPSESNSPVPSETMNPVLIESMNPVPNETMNPPMAESMMPSASVTATMTPSMTNTVGTSTEEEENEDKKEMNSQSPSPSTSQALGDGDDEENDDGNSNDQMEREPLSGSCASLFTPNSQLSCLPFSNLGEVRTSVGSAQVRVRQLSGKFDIRFNAVKTSSASVTLTSIALRFSLPMSSAKGKVHMMTLGGGKGEMSGTISVDPADVMAPFTGNGCCGETVDLSVAVMTRREEMGDGSDKMFGRRHGMGSRKMARTAVGYAMFKTTVQCVDACHGQEGEVLMTDLSCPICEMVR